MTIDLITENSIVHTPDKSELENSKEPLIHSVIKSNPVDVASFLRSHPHYDINIKDTNGRTALYVAITEKANVAIDILLQSGATVDLEILKKSFWLFCKNQSLENEHILQSILMHAKDHINSPMYSKTKITILMKLAAQENTQLLKHCLQIGANIDQKSKDGFTALMCAAVSGKLESLKLLIEYGANVTLRDKRGYSAIDYAKNSGNEECLILLLANHPKNTLNSATLIARIILWLGQLIMESYLISKLTDFISDKPDEGAIKEY